MSRQHIVWLSWKDHAHPTAGGAEFIKQQLARNLVADGYSLTVVTARYPGSLPQEEYDGYQIVRRGNRYTTYLHAIWYYCRYLRASADVVIDEVNTIPYFARLYARKPVIVFAHQLARKIWFHELPPYIGWIGYLAEPVYLRILSSCRAVTVSESSQADLVRYGFRKDRITVIPEILPVKPLAKLPAIKQSGPPRLLIVGALRSMKRTLYSIRAFEFAKQQIPNLQLDIAGPSIGSYGQKVLKYIQHSPHASSITYHGRVSGDKKLDLMRNAKLHLAASLKEGWGLTVSEAASQGCVSVVYNVDGLRDAVARGKAGIICDPSPQAMARAVVKALEGDMSATRTAAHRLALSLTAKNSYRQFAEALTSSLK